MSNKRTKAKRKGGVFAPADVPATGVEGLEAPALAPRTTALGVVRAALGGALLISVSLGLGYGLYRYALSTPRFAVSEILVEGTRRLSREDVLGAAGIVPGANIFQVDAAEAERTLAATPWVESVKVERRLPGRVRIRLVEREPVALASLGGKLLLVSEDGTPFKELGAGDPADFPLVTGLSLAELGRDRRAELGRLAEALGLLDEYDQLPLGRALPAEEVHLSDPGDVVLVVGSEGASLHLGPPPFKGKLARAVRVMEQTVRSGGKPSAVFLDNSAHPERVVVRVK